MQKRLKGLSTMCIGLLLILVGRIGSITFINGEEYTREAVAQRTNIELIRHARGVIYDRNMIALTEGQSNLSVAVIPSECEDISKVERLLGKNILGNKVQVFAIPASADSTELLSIPGVVAINVSERYLQSGLLSHVIGYTSMGSVGFGIENSMDEYLNVDQTEGIATFTDAQSGTIAGLGTKFLGESTLKGVQLTVDYHIQEVCENVLKTTETIGAVVLLDAKTGNILAMASAPKFTQNNLEEHLRSNGTELVNRATANYDIGSVFKIIVTAAALEDGYATAGTNFTCNGTVLYNDKEFTCNALDGHGTLTLEQGFAHSCNVVFYELGQRIGAESLMDMARKFGLSQTVLSGEIEEQGGNIPCGDNVTGGQLANLSIGQGDIQVTPLQITRVIDIILNKGKVRNINLVSGIVEEDGRTLTDFVNAAEGEKMQENVISENTAKIIQQMMCKTVEFGTGRGIDIPNWGAGGKTGSAETGWINADGETMTHGWFAGFFPEENPRYICVVLSEDGKQGATSSAPIFAYIGKGIQELE